MMMVHAEGVLHFVGIGGIGMSGIAEVFLNQGYLVSGSDLNDSDTTRRLASLGAKIYQGHRAENIKNARVVVVSSAVRATNPEVVEAKRLRIPVIPRAEMLAELMRGKTGIAVAGSHGKTTTTSMLAAVLTHAGLDPTLVIGGIVNALGGNAKLGQGKYVVAEADESDGSFLQLPATYGVVTNIDNDHLDHYGNLLGVETAFTTFVSKLPFYGFAAVCGDDPGVRRCLSRFTKPFTTYGFSSEWDWYATDVTYQGLGSSFRLWKGGIKPESLGEIKLHVPGRHNVLNALAAVAISKGLGLTFEQVSAGLSEYKGVGRRFEIRYQDVKRKIAVVDDYGHHPTEILATLSAARSFWPGRIVCVFQPHRYTRTVHCHDGFLSAFNPADEIFLTDIYAAGEDPIEGVSSQTLAQDVKQAARPDLKITYSGDLKKTEEMILSQVRDGDLLLCLGAGSITKLPEKLIQALKK